jgi:hypothetical protein
MLNPRFINSGVITAVKEINLSDIRCYNYGKKVIS